jgi:uncharacterized protein (TIGR02145 family)
LTSFIDNFDEKLFMRIFSFFFISTLCFLSFSQTPGGGVVDIEGNSYSSVIIGTQEWMAENLRSTKFSNGEVIPNVTSDFSWETLTTPGWCWFQNNPIYDIPYGKLYNSWVATDSRNVCPTGWHVPSADEWNILFDYAFGTGYAGGKLKSTGNLQDSTGLWMWPNTQAIDEYGFNAVPSEYRYPIYFPYPNILGSECRFWTSTETDVDDAHMVRLRYDSGGILQTSLYNKRFGLALRCLKGQPLEIIEISNSEKMLVKIIDLMGRETQKVNNTTLIYIYSDGSIERVFINE